MIAFHRLPSGPPRGYETLPDGTIVTTYADGTLVWEHGDHYHRTDGPAIERGDGEEIWAIRSHLATPEHVARYRQLGAEAQAAADVALEPCRHGWSTREQQGCLSDVLDAVETLVDD